MPPAQKPTGAEGAARALPREQPVTAAAATPTPVNNESAGAEGAEFIAQDLSQDPPGNDDLLPVAAPAGRAGRGDARLRGVLLYMSNHLLPSIGRGRAQARLQHGAQARS